MARGFGRHPDIVPGMAQRWLVLAGVTISWAGMAIHDAIELPALVPGDPQFTIPTAIFVGLALAWLARPGPLTSRLLVAWTLLNLVLGGVVSALPLAILPWRPDASLQHYLLHAVYVATQVPLLLVLRRRRVAAVAAG